MKEEKWSLTKTGVVAALTGLAWLGTTVVRIPIPVTQGYFNIGDVFVILAGLWLGPVAGLLVGCLGPTIADAIGYPQFMLATFVTKGLEGFVVGVIGGGYKDYSIYRRIISASIGGLVMVLGYLVFEGFIYPFIGRHIPFFAITNLSAAKVEVAPNLIQAAIGVVGGLALWKPIGSSIKK